MSSEQSEAEKAAHLWEYTNFEWREHQELKFEKLEKLRRTIELAFLAGAAWAAQRWVRCSERLPGDEEVLIVWKGVVCTGWYMEGDEEMGAYWDISGRAMPVTNLEEVTHWMNKPAAPEVGK